MMSLTYRKLELLINLPFPMAATGINKEGMSLLLAALSSGLGSALMWPHSTLKKSS